jgi:hypothetical protein
MSSAIGRRGFLRLAVSGVAGAVVGVPPRACGGSSPSGGRTDPAPRGRSAARGDERVLLAYFSRPGETYWYGGRRGLRVGNTEVLAGMIAERLDCEVHRIEAADPYPDSYDETRERNVREQDADARQASRTRSARSTSTTRSCSPARFGTSGRR